MSTPVKIALKSFRDYLRNLINKRRIRPVTTVKKNWLRELPRYTEGVVNLGGLTLHYTDARSFLSAYEKIFEQQIYDFHAKTDKPRILDCGANVGLATLFWKLKWPEALITAFEPDSAAFKAMQKNLRNHCSLRSLDLLQKGVGNRDGKVAFYRKGGDIGYITGETRTNDENTMTVPIFRLKNYLDEEIDLLKIDIEGSELEVLKDCRDSLDKVRRVFVEYHSYKDKPQRLDELFYILISAGFRVHIQPELSSDKPFIEIRQEYGMDQLLNIFAFREEERE